MGDTVRTMKEQAASSASASVFAQAFLLAQHLARRADRELAPLGLTTSQRLLLAVVTRYPGKPPTLSEAAALYGTSRQNVKQVARQLESRGYLEITPDPNDARALRLHPTAAVARDFDHPQAHRRQLRFLRKLFDGLDEGDVVALEALLGRWLARLRDD
jgi:DNA-binding MarR family transcriptional regulator